MQKKNSQRKHAKEKQKINVLNETSPFTEKTFFIARKKTLTKETATSLKKIETKNIFKKKVKKTFLKKMKLSPYFCYVVLFLLKKTQTFDKKDFEKNLKKKHEKKKTSLKKNSC